MSTRVPPIPPRTWVEIRARPSRLLVLDYDGTLAPLREKRDEARMSQRVRSALQGVIASGATRVAIVSGRPLDELVALTKGLDVDRVAEHGWDELPRGGEPLPRPLPARSAWGLQLADDEAASHGWCHRIERKRCGRALHVRGLEAAQAGAWTQLVRAAWERIAVRHGLRVLGMDGGLELRATGLDKGTAVAALLAASPADTFVACLGDDETDEDAFALVAPVGLAIRVGGGERTSHANARLGSIDEVAEFLDRWAAVCEGGAPRPHD